MKQLETVQKAQKVLEKMLEIAEKRLEKPRHTRITVFEDGDFTVEIRHGESTGEITEEGFEKLVIQKLVYRASEERLAFRKVRQTEPEPSNEISEEEILELPDQ